MPRSRLLSRWSHHVYDTRPRNTTKWIESRFAKNSSSQPTRAFKAVQLRETAELFDHVYECGPPDSNRASTLSTAPPRSPGASSPRPLRQLPVFLGSYHHAVLLLPPELSSTNSACAHAGETYRRHRLRSRCGLRGHLATRTSGPCMALLSETWVRGEPRVPPSSRHPLGPSPGLPPDRSADLLMRFTDATAIPDAIVSA